MKTTAKFVVFIVVMMAAVGHVSADDDLDDLLNEFEDKIRGARDIIQDEVQKHFSGGEIFNCGYNDIYKSSSTPGRVFDPRFGLEVDMDRTVTRVPPGTDQSTEEFFLETCATKPAKEYWQSHLPANETRVLWQYFGGQYSGNIEFFPGFYDATPDPDYDARFRPWYSAAATGPKNVVLVIDTSGSMVDADRIGKARSAAKRILQTLTHTDFVSIVAFSDTVNVYPADTMVRATAANRALLAAWIDKLAAGGGTRFYDAMEAVFDVLDASRRTFPAKTSGCHTAILFLTDGKDGSSGDVLDLMEKRNNVDIDARVFTYALGDEADQTKPKQMACAHRGVFTAVGDDDDLENAMARYYVYFATGVNSVDARWSEMYLDAIISEYITSATLPVYVQRPGHLRELFGVVAVDIKESPLLLNGTLTRDDVNAFLLDRSKSCPDLSLNEEQLTELRGDNQCDGSGLPGWAIALIVVGSLAALGGIIVGVMYCKGVAAGASSAA